MAHTTTPLANKVVWITGASSGIGEALAYALAARGARLILSARRAERLAEVAARCKGVGASVDILPLDLADGSSLAASVREASAAYGIIDILVNNAGISQRAEAIDTAPDVVRTIIETNLIGPVILTAEVARRMRERGSGLIVVVSSLVGKVGSPLRSAYAASKHALHGYFDSLRMELAGRGVGVLLVVPGFVRTEISLAALEATGQPHGRMDPGQRDGMSPEAAAERILRAIAAGKEEISVGFDARARLAVILRSLAPRLLARIMAKARVV